MTELESLVGGALRARHTLTNTAPGTYVVDGLEVVLPAADHLTEVLDFTGRHERERSPQRHRVTDGLWLREGRGGRPGLDAASMVVLGTDGFSTTRGEVYAVHVGWSGNTVLRVERSAATGTTVGGGEHLQPGEVDPRAGRDVLDAVGVLRRGRRRARRPRRRRGTPGSARCRATRASSPSC